MRISDWSSDVCSSDLGNFDRVGDELLDFDRRQTRIDGVDLHLVAGDVRHRVNRQLGQLPNAEAGDREEDEQDRPACADGERNETCNRSEEHTSELQSLMRNSYAVLCLKKKTTHHTKPIPHTR